MPARRQTLDDYIKDAGSLRSAARLIGCSPATLSTLSRGHSHASPELADKLRARHISLKGLTAHCPNCRAVRNGPHCPRCGVICVVRNGVRPYFPDSARAQRTNKDFYTRLIDTMRRNGDDHHTITAVVDEARSRGYTIPSHTA